MNYILIVLLVVSGSAHSADFGEIIQNMKKQMRNMFAGGTDESAVATNTFDLPTIPQVKQGATSTQVYDKTGKIYQQGAKFNNLPLEQKRKFRVAFINELYLVVRGSAASDDELRRNLNILEQGGTREGVYRSLVLGRDYNNLETFEENPSDPLVSFTVGYAIKYLALQYQKEQISQLNLWGIKRVIIEKTLEIMDSFPSDGEDLHKWYAHLSLDFAKNYSSVWKNKSRKSLNLEFHKRWAEMVPLQQIKSEVIIKISRVMNSLQK